MDEQCHKDVFKWVKNTFQFNKAFIETFNEDSDERYFLEVYIQYPKNLRGLSKDLPFLIERIKIEKVEALLANLHDKKEFVLYILNLKQALNHGLVLKKVHS